MAFRAQTVLGLQAPNLPEDTRRGGASLLRRWGHVDLFVPSNYYKSPRVLSQFGNLPSMSPHSHAFQRQHDEY